MNGDEDKIMLDYPIDNAKMPDSKMNLWIEVKKLVKEGRNGNIELGHQLSESSTSRYFTNTLRV